jgi:hypothetical protein
LREEQWQSLKGKEKPKGKRNEAANCMERAYHQDFCIVHWLSSGVESQHNNSRAFLLLQHLVIAP